MTDDQPKPPEHTVEAAITDKKEHITDVVQERMEKLSARQEAYQRIIDLTKRGIEDYYRRYPERAVDGRSQDAEQASIQGLRDIFNVLDGYMISYRDER